MTRHVGSVSSARRESRLFAMRSKRLVGEIVVGDGCSSVLIDSKSFLSPRFEGAGEGHASLAGDFFDRMFEMVAFSTPCQGIQKLLVS